jgi:UDP-N-acetylglucosamine/UDP-N-acetylgalactosamine diphosphorylase
MQHTLAERYAEARRRCLDARQDHLLAFWPDLADAERADLLADIDRIDFRPIPALIEQFVRRRPPHAEFQRIEPAPAVSRDDVDRGTPETRDAFARGRDLIAAGSVAALIVAGGQGTRLGLDGPKGCLPVSPILRKPLFQLFAEQLLATGRRTGRPIQWYIMTSPANDAATRAFFDVHAFFGLHREQVFFFQQGVMPAFGVDGRILLEQKHRVALAPNGHGGTLLALADSGALADMARRGVEFISYFQVDNPLVSCVDPLFIGLHAVRGCDMSTKITAKADDRERVGNCVLADGKVCVIEYSDLPDDLATAKNPDGSRRFNAANLAIHVISRRFVERLTADPTRFALPWHRAEKKVSHIDPATGRRIEPAEPNAIKLESFIFDAMPLSSGTPLLLEVDRAEEFSPIKNATGVDSLETARRDMIRRAARWLERAGRRVPRRPDGEPAVPIEISPLRALSAGDLERDPPPIDPDGPILIE